MQVAVVQVVIGIGRLGQPDSESWLWIEFQRAWRVKSEYVDDEAVAHLMVGYPSNSKLCAFLYHWFSKSVCCFDPNWKAGECRLPEQSP